MSGKCGGYVSAYYELYIITPDKTLYLYFRGFVLQVTKQIKQWRVV